MTAAADDGGMHGDTRLSKDQSPMSVRTTFHSCSWPVTVSHHSCSDFGPRGDRHVIVANDCEPNTLTTVEIGSAALYVHWERKREDQPVHILFLPETSVLFFGAGTLVVSLRVPSLEIVDRNNLCEFQGFRCKEGFVAQLGELECNLYGTDGGRIATAAVDPPYEVEETPEGYKFTSDVAGVAWLRYPRNSTGIAPR